MFKTLNDDRYYIERKFHNPDEEFDPFIRMVYHGEGYDMDTGLSDEEIIAGLKALDLDKLPHPVARAMAISYVLENERLYINEHDYFVGLYSLNRLANQVTFNKWQESSRLLREKELVELSDDFNKSGAVAIWTDYDHVVPDWKSLMELGFKGVLDRAKGAKEAHIKKGDLTDEMAAYYEGIEIQYSAIIDLIDRMENHAKTKTHKKAEKIAKCLNSIKQNPPQNIYEAMQLIVIYFLVSESVDSYQVRSLGNGLDATLYPFYIRDIENGTFTRDEICELLGYFMLQWSSIGNYWGQPFYLGGTKLDGSTKYNDLSFDIIDVYDKLDIYNPKIQIKTNVGMPDSIINKVLEMVIRKNASFVFCGEPGMIDAVMHYGATYEEALNMDIRGCYETGVRANEVCTGTGYVNAAKAVEYVFTRGYDSGIQKHIGVETQSVDDMKSFEEFYSAFIMQWSNLIEKSIAIANDAELYLSFVNPSSMYSATIEGSVEKGRDAYQGCVKYNNSAMLNCSFASAVDSVMAVYEFVFEKKEATLTDFKEAVLNNWDGYEKLRMKVRCGKHKYGNGDNITDIYAKAMADYFSNKVNNTPNSRGGVYKAILHSARQFIIQGEKTLATPDGRRKGEELSKNASASIGMDKNGVTALTSSALKLTPSNYPESFCLDVTLHPTAVSGDEGIDIIKSILMHYVKNKGMSMQFNIFNADMLRDAQQNPEKYKNLQVRVCGWNVLWNNMSKQEQDAYIKRAENII